MSEGAKEIRQDEPRVGRVVDTGAVPVASTLENPVWGPLSQQYAVWVLGTFQEYDA